MRVFLGRRACCPKYRLRLGPGPCGCGDRPAAENVPPSSPALVWEPFHWARRPGATVRPRGKRWSGPEALSPGAALAH